MRPYQHHHSGLCKCRSLFLFLFLYFCICFFVSLFLSFLSFSFILLFTLALFIDFTCTHKLSLSLLCEHSSFTHSSIEPVTSSQTSLGLQWAGSFYNGASMTAFLVQMQPVSLHGTGEAFALACNVSVSQGQASSGSCKALGLGRDTLYSVRACAVSAAGTGPWSSLFTYHTDVNATPSYPAQGGAPRLLVALADGLRVSWPATAYDGGAQLLHYDLQMRTMPDGSFHSVYQGLLVLTYNASNLTAATSYCFRVRAVNHVGTGAWSPGVCFVTANANAPDPPMLSASPVTTGSTYLQVSWSVPDAHGSPIRSYELQVDNYWTDQPLSLVYTGPNTTFRTGSNLLPATIYNFRASARNAVGNSVRDE